MSGPPQVLPSDAAPNPLAGGQVSLTMPVRRRRPAGADRAGGGCGAVSVSEQPAVAMIEPLSAPWPALDESAPPADVPPGGDASAAEDSPADDSAAGAGEPIADAGDVGGGGGGCESGEVGGLDGLADGDGRRLRGADRHSVRVLATLAVVVALIAGLVWWFAQPSAPPKPVHTMAALPTSASPAPAPTTAPAVAPPQDGPLQITLTAVCPGQTDPRLAASTDRHSGWSCPTGGVPFGQKLTATLPQPSVITGIKFWPGFDAAGADGRDEWPRHRLLSEVQFGFNDRDLTQLTGLPNGERREYTLVVDHLVASQVEMTVIASVPAPPQPTAVPTAVPGQPGDLSSIFPASGPAGDADGGGPDASTVAVTGFTLIGHPVR